MTSSFIDRTLFPALTQQVDGQPINYLDSAATTLKPEPVIQAVTDYYRYNGANIHRGKHRLSDEASNAYEAARLDVADYIGAQANEVVFTANATQALNLVAYGLNLTNEDLVITGMDSHHSNILPWRHTAQTRLIRTDRNGRLDLEHFQALLKNQPKVVALTHCSNVTGVIHPIEQLIRLTREHTDALIVLDAAQSMPHSRLNLHQLGADFVAFSAHKMLGPTGIGFLYANSRRLDSLRPLFQGGGTVDWVDLEGQVNRRAPYHLEAGTPPIASVIGAGSAFRFLTGLNDRDRSEHDQRLTDALVAGANARPYLSLIGPADSHDRHAIGSFRFNGRVSVGELARLLSDSYGIMCRSGYLCAQPFVSTHAGGEVLRASAYLYNEVADITALFSALDELADCMGLTQMDAMSIST